MASLHELTSAFLASKGVADHANAAHEMFAHLRTNIYEFEYVPERDLRAFRMADDFLDRCQSFIKDERDRFRKQCDPD